MYIERYDIFTIHLLKFLVFTKNTITKTLYICIALLKDGFYA